MTETQLYLISPLDVGGTFPQRLERALAAGKGLVTAFQFRVKGVESHEAAALAEPLQAICAAHDVAFIVNDDVALAKIGAFEAGHHGGPDLRLADVDLGVGAVDLRQQALALGLGDHGTELATGTELPQHRTEQAPHWAGHARVKTRILQQQRGQ